MRVMAIDITTAETELMAASAKNSPIGVFDSGVGGLSVLRVLEQRLPAENYIYFGDTARVPYGNRSPQEVRDFTVEIGSWLQNQGCKMILIACNTATVLGMEALAAVAKVPVYGMVEAALAGAMGAMAGGQNIAGQNTAGLWPLGLIATQGTVESGGYQAAVAVKAPGQPFYAQPCPDFVPLIEKGVLTGPDVEQAVEKYLKPLKEKGIATLILGCTHYPFLAPAIAAYLGEAVRLVDPARQLAIMVEEYLKARGLLNDGATGVREFYCSGDSEAFKAQGSKLLGRPLKEIRKQVF